MDFLQLDLNFQVLICTRCQYALVPGTIATHLATIHEEEVAKDERRDCVELWKDQPLQPAEAIQQYDLPVDTLPIPNLALHHNGIRCCLCTKLAFVSKSSQQMRHHLKKIHGWMSGRKGGRPPKASTVQETELASITDAPVSYQTFHRSNFLRYFQVTPLPTANNSQQPLPATLEDQVEQQLAQKLDAATAAASRVLQPPAEPSAWLQTTDWIRYLEGHNLQAAAELIALPHPSEPEPELVALLDALDRLVEQARNSILQGKVNAFDQQRINSFLRSGSRSSKASDRPLAYKLHKNTYAKYKSTWKQLLCFVYRLVYQQQQPALHCLLTPVQLAALDQVAQAAHTYVREQQEMPAFQSALDHACLRFCIALLDQRLMGDLYDSVIVGFLAVLGIDKAREGFQEAIPYTPHLSAIVKIAQLLVLQRAVVAAETGETEYPADMLEVLHDRFMVYGSRSPINWVQKLRVYGKKIRDSTTSLGYMVWSDDGQELEYRSLQFSMTGLKQFVRQQVSQAQDQLQQLLLIHAEEAREDVVPKLRLQDLKDNPALSRLGQSFLTDLRNPALQGHDRWLLNRVLKHSWLQDEFFVDVQQARWKAPAVEDYLSQVDAFLEQLLLLVHITSGQPARGTELLSLQYCNAAHGRRRNIFIENGLVTIVTLCYKGYSITNSTKIIHRYLPQEVSEQTGHTALVAGNVYARGIEEAPGHVASAHTEYRALSRAWHSFLGFGMFLGILPPNSLKRPWDSSMKQELEQEQKRRACLGEADIEAEVQRRVEQELCRRGIVGAQL